jgi:hypothetical protein
MNRKMGDFLISFGALPCRPQNVALFESIAAFFRLHH